MFIVFHGKGWLVPVTAIGSIVVTGLAGIRDPLVIWPVMALGGLVDHHFGRKWNGQEGRLLQDLETGEVHEVKPDHSFFWIKVQHWLWLKIAFAVLAVAMVLQKAA